MHATKSTLKRSLIGMGIALAALGPAAGASAAGSHDARPDRGGHRHAERGHGCGVLTIGRHSHEFEVGRCIERSLARALRHEGYRAWVEDGCVFVDGRLRHVRVRASGYSFSIWRDGCLTVIRPKQYHSGHRSYRGFRSYDRRGYRGWRDRGGPRWRSRRGCDAGFGIRLGNGRIGVRVPIR